MAEGRLQNIVIGQQVSQEKVRLACAMRRDMTAAEAVLWKRLRTNALGVHFRRQQVISGFIADFYCHKAALVVEVDGATHKEDYDAERDQVFSSLGIEVMRFSNAQVQQQIGVVLSQIRQRLKEPTPSRSSPPLPKREG